MRALALALSLTLGQWGIDGIDFAAPGDTAQPDLVFVPSVGVDPSPITPTRGPDLTLTRATPRTCLSTPTTMLTAAAGELCVGYQGAAVEPGAVNLAPYSDNLSGPGWSNFGATVTGTCAGPLGPGTLSLIDGTAGGPGVFKVWGQSFVSGSLTHTEALWMSPPDGVTPTQASVYVYMGSTNPTCACECIPAAACSGGCATESSGGECIANLTLTGMTRVILYSVGTTGTPGASLIGLQAGWKSGAGTVICAGLVDAVDGAVMGSHVTTLGTPVSYDPDILTVPASVLGSGAASVRLVMTPSWASDATSGVVLLDSDGDLSLSVPSDDLGWFVAGAATTATGPLGWTAGTSQTVDAWYGLAGAALRVSDGTHTGSLPTGSAGPPTATTLYVGGDATAGAGVAVSRLAICQGSTTTCQ